MNNDISRNMCNSANAPKTNNINSFNIMRENLCQNVEVNEETKKPCNPDEFLGAMGSAQVNMDNPLTSKAVKSSVEEFIKNPELAQLHVDLCDSLVEKGYPLEKAIDITDNFFKVLMNDNTELRN